MCVCVCVCVCVFRCQDNLHCMNFIQDKKNQQVAKSVLFFTIFVNSKSFLISLSLYIYSEKERDNHYQIVLMVQSFLTLTRYPSLSTITSGSSLSRTIIRTDRMEMIAERPTQVYPCAMVYLYLYNV